MLWRTTEFDSKNWLAFLATNNLLPKLLKLIFMPASFFNKTHCITAAVTCVDGPKQENYHCDGRSIALSHDFKHHNLDRIPSEMSVGVLIHLMHIFSASYTLKRLSGPKNFSYDHRPATSDGNRTEVPLKKSTRA